MPITKPETSEHSPYHETYLKLVTGNDLIAALEEGGKNTATFFKSIPAAKLDFKYEADKWNIKEILAHIIDVERVFSNRALWFARNDKAEQPGFDDDNWTLETNTANRTLDQMLNEYTAVRASTIALFSSLTIPMTQRTGTANGNKVSVRALGYIIPGHEIHHIGTIKERYL